MTSFAIPDNTANFEFNEINVFGSLAVSFVGFTVPGKYLTYIGRNYPLLSLMIFKGVNSAVPVGTQVTYACPKDYVFEHDWYLKPEIR